MPIRFDESQGFPVAKPVVCGHDKRDEQFQCHCGRMCAEVCYGCAYSEPSILDENECEECGTTIEFPLGGVSKTPFTRDLSTVTSTSAGEIRLYFPFKVKDGS